MTQQSKGIAALFFTAFMFAIGGFFIREVSIDLDVFPQLAIRTSLQAGVLFIIGFFMKDFKKLSSKDYKMFIGRGLVVFVDVVLFIYAVNDLPLGLTLFAWYAASIITHYVYGYYLLSEKITRTKLLSFVTSFIGLLLIYGFSISYFSFWPLLAAVGSGASFGISMGMSKPLTNKFSMTQVATITVGIISVLSFIAVYITGDAVIRQISSLTWLWILLHVSITILSTYTILYGYKVLDAQIAGIVLLAEILFAIVIGYFAYNEIPLVTTLIGGIFISFALVLPNLKKSKNS